MKLIGGVVQVLVSAVIAAAIVFWGMEVYQEMQQGGTQDVQIQQEKPNEVLQQDRDTNSDEVHMMQRFEESLVTMIQEVSPSVVNVVANQDFEYYQRGLLGAQPRMGTRELGGGSGFLVDRDGYIITNRHVVDDTRLRYTVVYEDGTSAEIDEIRLDPSLDIAVLKVSSGTIPERVQALEVLDINDSVSLGQFAFAIGNTLAEFQNSVTFGIVSGRNRTIDIGLRNRYAGLYQTDTAISQGNSGGPLFNTQGKVIGVNTAVSALGENIGFSIPITQQFVGATLSSIKEFQEIRRPFIGISYVDLDPTSAQQYQTSVSQGVLIQEVVPESAAQVGGLQAGDIITMIDGKQIDDEFPLQYLLFTKLPNDTITVEVLRDQEIVSVILKVGEQ